MRAVLKNPLRYVTAFTEFFLAFYHLVLWIICNIRKIQAEVIAEVVGSFIFVTFTGIMSIIALTLLGFYIILKWLLHLNLKEVAKGTVKLGFISLLCVIAWNWRDSLSLVTSDGKPEFWVNQGVGQKLQMSVASGIRALRVGSDTSKKAALKDELQKLQEQLKKVEGDVEWAFLDTPSLGLLEVQMNLKTVNFDRFRRGLEEVQLRISLLLELAKTAPPTKEIFNTAMKNADSNEFQNAREDQMRLHNRIEMVSAVLESQSLRNHSLW